MSQKRKYWVDKMLSGDDGVSSKRVAGMILLINVLVFCYTALLKDMILPDFMFEAVCFLTGGLLGITALENMFKRPATPPATTTDETTQ
jgi:hypothetical protein